MQVLFRTDVSSFSSENYHFYASAVITCDGFISALSRPEKFQWGLRMMVLNSKTMKSFRKTFRHISHNNEPRSEKTGLRGFRPGPRQTGLYSHRRRLEA